MEFLDGVATLWTVAWRAMLLDPSVWHPAAAGQLQAIAYTIAIVAALFQIVGQSFILAINRVSGLRALTSLALGIAINISALVFLALAMWVAMSAVLERPLDLLSTLAIVALAQSPHVLGVFSLIPHFGLYWQRLLEAWAMVCLVHGVVVESGLHVLVAAMVALAGWGLTRAMEFAVRPALRRLAHRAIGEAVLRSMRFDPALAGKLKRRAAAVRIRPEATP